jgi:hypothetical protein
MTWLKAVRPPGGNGPSTIGKERSPRTSSSRLKVIRSSVVEPGARPLFTSWPRTTKWPSTASIELFGRSTSICGRGSGAVDARVVVSAEAVRAGAGLAGVGAAVATCTGAEARAS